MNFFLTFLYFRQFENVLKHKGRQFLVIRSEFSVVLALIRDSIMEQTCLFHPTLSPSLDTFLSIEQELASMKLVGLANRVVNFKTNYIR